MVKNIIWDILLSTKDFEKFQASKVSNYAMLVVNRWCQDREMELLSNWQSCLRAWLSYLLHEMMVLSHITLRTCNPCGDVEVARNIIKYMKRPSGRLWVVISRVKSTTSEIHVAMITDGQVARVITEDTWRNMKKNCQRHVYDI